MKILIKLAWRNIWRNKRRSILTILAVTFAGFLSIAQRGIQIGTYDVNIKTLAGMYTGYLQIQKSGYLKKPSLNLNFPYNENISKYLDNISEITSHTPRIETNGLICFKNNSFGIALIGIKPGTEKNTSTIFERINSGNFFSSDTTNEIVLGYKLLKKLKAHIGDDVIILSQDNFGALSNKVFKISGSVKTGSEFDESAVFVGLSASQDFLDLNTSVNTIVLSISNLDRIQIIKAKLKDYLFSKNLVCLSWDEIVPDFKQSIEFDNISGILFLGVLIVIVAFGILNTVLMSITERFREFGVILSIGLSQTRLVCIIYIEILFITVIGLLIGNVIALGINYFIIQNPIVFGGDVAALYQEFGFIPRIESSLKLSIFLNSSFSILLISLIVCIYPIYKVYYLEPIKGIRYT